LKNPDRFNLEPSFFRFFGPNLYYDILSLSEPAPTLGIVIESIRLVLEQSS
jgi:hypothetical protein